MQTCSIWYWDGCTTGVGCQAWATVHGLLSLGDGLWDDSITDDVAGTVGCFRGTRCRRARVNPGCPCAADRLVVRRWCRCRRHARWVVHAVSKPVSKPAPKPAPAPKSASKSASKSTSKSASKSAFEPAFEPTSDLVPEHVATSFAVVGIGKRLRLLRLYRQVREWFEVLQLFCFCQPRRSPPVLPLVCCKWFHLSRPAPLTAWRRIGQCLGTWTLL